MVKFKNFMINTNTAIVLKTYFPEKNKILIFDRTMGKLNVSLSANKISNLCNGTIFTYDFNEKNTFFIINNLNILDVPLNIGKTNILFLHNILEICYYFLPFGVVSNELFDLISFLYFYFDKFQTDQLQKFFLCRVFLILGIYPEVKMSDYFNYVMSLPIDMVDKNSIDLSLDKELNLWIIKCMQIHPYKNSLKTINFLTRVAVT